MSENAPGQLLGFTIQYPRALCHLLQAGPGSIVCLEVLGDVATVLPDGTVHAEEDKSSIRNNPVTDKSIELWKTLFNWVNAVLNGELNINKTTFILYRNKSGRKGLAEAFSEAQTETEALKVIDQAAEKLLDIGEQHDIWPYYKSAAIDNKQILSQIIQNFHLDSGTGASYKEVEEKVISKHVPVSQIRTLVAAINGWLVRLVSEKIASNLDAKITWEEFDEEFKVHFTRARRLELIDFTLSVPPTSAEVDLHLKARPLFLQQIELVGTTDDEILEAVTNYLKAKTNRDRWIEDEIINEQLAADFETKLLSFWRNTQKKYSITHKALSMEELGQLLLSDCMVRQELIGSDQPPSSTIAGTYHALADKPIIGWHTNWKERFLK